MPGQTELQNVFSSPGALKFLGASVLSFNSNLGIGSGSESTLSVELVEDCDEGDIFEPNVGLIEVGEPVYFDTSTVGATFMFGGVLTNWTKNRSSSGDTFSATVTDPRQLLQNVGVVVDSYLGPPVNGVNYINVFAYFESDVLNGNCAVFGDSLSNERGMPYDMIIQALTAINPTIYSPTGFTYTINWGSFPTGLPEYYRVAGPQTILQLLQDVCDATGNIFYVTLVPGNIIQIGLIDLKVVPGSFSEIIDEFDGEATELSYGQELRNDVTKAIIFGEQVHYLTYVDKFNFYFGEDLNENTGEYYPVIPVKIENNIFWIYKNIKQLNATLLNPLDDGSWAISERDIQAAMSSYDLWMMRVFDTAIGVGMDTLNQKIRDKFPLGLDALKDRLANIENNQKEVPDLIQNPNLPKTKRELQEYVADLEKIHSFVADLGNTYYGKQFLCPLKETICYYIGDDFQEKIFSSVPTNAGGWIEQNAPILGLSDPDLGLFRSDDNRITSFSLFTLDGQNDAGDENTDDIPETSPSDSPTGE